MATTLKSSHVVFQLPNIGSWFENLAIRSDGTVLVTRVDVPEVWLIDPSTGKGETLLKLPSPITSVTGITELSLDVFALGTGQYDLAKGAVQGSFEIWTFSLANGTAAAESSLDLICKTPNAGLINGLTTWKGNTILAVDSTHGDVYLVDIDNKTSTVVLSDELTKPPPDAPLPIGINGVKVFDEYIYFTNTARQSFYRVPVDDKAKPKGPIEVIASGFASDDFVVDTDGTAYIVTHIQNSVVMIKPGSKEAVTIAGKADTLEIAGGTACAFGRKSNDAGILYVVTAGALSLPVNGQVEPAKLVAVEMK